MSNIDKDFVNLSRALKRAGQTELRRKLNKAMRKAAKPVIKDVKDALVRELPHKGGLGEYIAGKPFRIVTRTGRDPGVKIAIIHQDPRLEALGRLAHPVFDRGTTPSGNKRLMVVQHVKPGIVGHQLDASAPKVKAELEAAIKDMYREVIVQVDL